MNLTSFQTWYLSKILQHWIFRQTFYTVNLNSFSDKITTKLVFMEKFTPLAKILHSRREWEEGQISPLRASLRKIQDPLQWIWVVDPAAPIEGEMIISWEAPERIKGEFLPVWRKRLRELLYSSELFGEKDLLGEFLYSSCRRLSSANVICWTLEGICKSCRSCGSCRRCIMGQMHSHQQIFESPYIRT